MAPYCVLFLLLAVLIIYSRVKKTDNRSLLYINAACMLSVSTILMLRHESMGIDLLGVKGTIGYLGYFDKAARLPFVEFTFQKPQFFEFGFRLYVKALATIWNSHQFFIAVTALLSLIPIAVLFWKKSKDPAFSWLIYVSLMPFMILFSGLRQGIAIGIGAMMFILAEDKKPVWFVVAGVLAAAFHVSSVLLFLVYPLFRLKIARKWRIIGTPVLLLLLLLIRKIIIEVGVRLFPNYAYAFIGDGSGSYKYFVMMFAIYLLCCVFMDDSELQNAYMNYYFLACVFQMFGFFSEHAPRAGFYFTIALPVLLPDIIKKIKNTKWSITAYVGAVLCFVLLGFYTIYTTDWAVAYPYHWFWETVV